MEKKYGLLSVKVLYTRHVLAPICRGKGRASDLDYEVTHICTKKQKNIAVLTQEMNCYSSCYRLSLLKPI